MLDKSYTLSVSEGPQGCERNRDRTMEPCGQLHSTRSKATQTSNRLLVFVGCVVIVSSLVFIGCAFAINYDDDFSDTEEAKQAIQTHFSYCQYWTGIPVRTFNCVL